MKHQVAMPSGNKIRCLGVCMCVMEDVEKCTKHPPRVLCPCVDASTSCVHLGSYINVHVWEIWVLSPCILICMRDILLQELSELPIVHCIWAIVAEQVED